MEPIYTKIHPKFRLNGVSYTVSALRKEAQNLIKEGMPFEQTLGSFLLNWLDPKSSIEVKTSGSTGKPKTIILQKRQMVASVLATAKFFGLQAGTTAFLCLPVDFIAGKMMLVRAMVSGLELDYVEPSSNPLSKISKNYDFGAMVPPQLENSLKQVDQIKILIVGGAALSTSLRAKVQDKATAIFETYGMTETITHIAVKKVNNLTTTSENLPAKVTERSRSELFRTLPHITLSADNRGCLVIEAPKISDTHIVTNDMVKIISETEFEWRGRYDNIINSGGIKLMPEEIECKLASVIENRFFVTGLPDEKLGQKLVLVIEGDFDSDKLLHRIKASAVLERFEIPKSVFFIPKFLDTETGKVNRKANLKLILE